MQRADGAAGRLRASPLIWRLIGPEGQGAYGEGGPRRSDTVGDYYSPTRHPGPWEDPCVSHAGDLETHRTEDHLFGFSSVRQARAWWYVPEDLARWEADGFRLVAYRREDVTAVRRSRRQAIFIPKPGASPARLAPTALHSLSARALGAAARVQLENA